MADWIDVVRSVPCSPHIEEFTAVCYFSAHVETADGGLMDANEVNPTVGDKAEPLLAIDEELAHGQGCGSFLAEYLEPTNILRREGILHVKRPVLLHGLAELNRLIRCGALVYVVYQSDIVGRTWRAEPRTFQWSW